MSTMTLVRQKGILVDENNQPIENKVEELRDKIRNLRKEARKNSDGSSTEEKEDLEEKIEKLRDEITELYQNSKTLIDLRKKILVFLEPPNYELWNVLKPILSHDKKEIKFPFTNQTQGQGHQAKDVAVYGWPACIFCSARDESKWEVWNEIKSRFMISSPNIIQRKYDESKELIAIKKGKPNSIQQQLIISNHEIELTRQCVLLLKQKINELRSKNNNNDDEKISLWIPYAELLQKEIPVSKGPDIRLIKRIFSLLNVVPIVKSYFRKSLVLEDEISVIAELEDLKEVLSITQNREGIPEYKIKFFDEIFYPCYQSKEGPDLDNTKQEERKAVTTKQLCEFFKEKRSKPISTDNLKKVYLNELINNGLIDYTPSKIHGRQDIYFPLIEPLSFTINEDESLSSLSNLASFDKVSQHSSLIYEKITKKVNETWIFYEIIRLVSYRIDLGRVRGPFADFLNNNDKFHFRDIPYSQDKEQQLSSFDNDKINSKQKEEKCICNIDVKNGKMTIGKFIDSYTTSPSNRLVDSTRKRGSNTLSLGKISPFLSNCPKFDEKDKKDEKENGIKDDKIKSTDEETEGSDTSHSPSFKCYRCPKEFSTKEDYANHSLNKHPRKPIYPELSLIKSEGLEPKGNPWEK